MGDREYLLVSLVAGELNRQHEDDRRAWQAHDAEMDRRIQALEERIMKMELDSFHRMMVRMRVLWEQGDINIEHWKWHFGRQCKVAGRHVWEAYQRYIHAEVMPPGFDEHADEVLKAVEEIPEDDLQFVL